MPGMPWIKVYSEILDDPKIGRLQDATKWLFVSLLLLAGECDAEGYLVNANGPLTLADVAWRLRVSEDSLQQGIEILREGGLITQDRDTWLLPKFSERQGRPQEERREQWREQKRRQRSGEPDTELESADDPEESQDGVLPESAEGPEECPQGVSEDSARSPQRFRPLEVEGEGEGEEEKGPPAIAGAGAPPPAPSAAGPPLQKGRRAKAPPDPQRQDRLRALFGALAEVAGMDPTANRGRLNREAALLDDAHFTAEQVRAFLPWWKTHDWRGRKGERPTPAQVREGIQLSVTTPVDERPIDTGRFAPGGAYAHVAQPPPDGWKPPPPILPAGTQARAGREEGPDVSR